MRSLYASRARRSDQAVQHHASEPNELSRKNYLITKRASAGTQPKFSFPRISFSFIDRSDFCLRSAGSIMSVTPKTPDRLVLDDGVGNEKPGEGETGLYDDESDTSPVEVLTGVSKVEAAQTVW